MLTSVSLPPVPHPRRWRTAPRGCTVIGQALGLEQHEIPARQHPAQGRDRRRVRRSRAAPRMSASTPWQTKEVCHGRHGESGGNHQQSAQQDDAAQVPPDQAERGGQLIPEQHDRQEDQQHRLRWKLDLPQLRNEAKDKAEDQKQQGYGRPESGSQDRAREHGHTQEDDGFQAPCMVQVSFRLCSMALVDGRRGTYQVDAIVRATTRACPWGSNQERSVRRQVALEPRMVGIGEG